MAAGSAVVVEDDADRPWPKAIETAIVEEESAVDETAVVIETEVVVAVVGGRGPRSRHHESGDGCRHEQHLAYGMASHRLLPSLVIRLHLQRGAAT